MQKISFTLAFYMCTVVLEQIMVGPFKIVYDMGPVGHIDKGALELLKPVKLCIGILLLIFK